MEYHIPLIVVLALVIVTSLALPFEYDPEAAGKELANEFQMYEERGLETPRFKELLSTFSLPDPVLWLGQVGPNWQCTLCNGVFTVILRYYNARKTPEEIASAIISMCTTFKISTENVCTGVVNLNTPSLLHILNTTKDLTASKICGVVLQSSSCSTNDPSLEWTVDVDMGPKPDPPEPQSSYKGANEKMEIVQLTDIHYEPDYTVNGNAACDEPMCCRRSQGNATDENGTAGYWGDYRKCDLPWHTLQNLLTQIKTTHKNVDYIYMTGDIVDHVVWDTSPEKNTEYIKNFTTELKSTFGDTPIFPILGNHETSPVNVFAPLSITDERISTGWLYELVAESWSSWLPPETKETILKGGFYTTLVKPGFRIIGINNNVCYTLNWWLLHDSKDPYDQLKWLAETLIDAEKNGEKVHILGHVPSGDPWCLKTWSREYQKIIDRFEYTITAQFNGHTHYDEYQLFYSSTNKTATTAVAFNGGSATTYENLNPNYKVYYVQADNMVVTDYDNWIFNLTEANLNKDQPPKWYKLYTCSEAYELDSLSPKHMHDLAYKMAKNESTLMQYHRYYMKNADPMVHQGCDATCQKQYLCQIVTSNSADDSQCEAIMQVFENP